SRRVQREDRAGGAEHDNEDDSSGGEGDPRAEERRRTPARDEDAGHEQRDRDEWEPPADRDGDVVDRDDERKRVGLRDHDRAVDGRNRLGEADPAVDEPLPELIDDRAELDPENAR